MWDLGGLLARYGALVPEVLRLVKDGRRILVVTHLDADGLCSGSIMYSSLARKGANVVVRTVPELDPEVIQGLRSLAFDYYIFTDLASTLIQELEASFDGRYLVMDHHQLSAEDTARPSVVNAWAYGYDGGREACSSSMAYFFATTVEPSNTDLSPLAVVGALADRQDGGPGRSLTGLNEAATKDAIASGLVSVTKDLMFSGRETRPIHEAVAMTSTPYLKGMSGSKDAVLAALHQSGMALKHGGSWRTISGLTPEEKMQLTEVIAGSLGTSEGATEALAGLFGQVYTLAFEDSFTPLRDAREFGTLLNSCGRMRAPGTGIAICLGDRGAAMKAAMTVLSEYRAAIYGALQALTSEPGRFETSGSLAIVKGEGIVDERLLGPVISILTSSQEFKDKIVIGRTTSGDSDLKVSARIGDDFKGEMNLGSIMYLAATEVGGVGGGHTMAAGAKIPADRLEAFSRSVSGQIAS